MRTDSSLDCVQKHLQAQQLLEKSSTAAP